MPRSLYANSCEGFCLASPEEILGGITVHVPFAVEPAQRDAWLQEIELLKPVCMGVTGRIHFEFSIPRMGALVVLR